VDGFGSAAPAPVFPGERPEDKVIVEDDDMEFVARPAKRGRPRREYSPEELSQVLRLYFVEKLSMRRVADILGVSHMSIYRMLSDPNIELLI